MSLNNFSWHDNKKRFMEGDHAIFGASKSYWINYSIDKMLEIYNTEKATKIGTELHALAAELIRKKIALPNEKQTLNMYVNDSILLGLRPEQRLYYSPEFYGTADGIGIGDRILRVFDLKTGKTKASMRQLVAYVCFFLLEYNLIPSDFDEIELRIYQNNDVQICKPEADEIVPIMDKIVTVDQMIQKLKEV